MPAPESVRDIIIALASRARHKYDCQNDPCFCGLNELLERAANILMIVEHERAAIDHDLVNAIQALGALREQIDGGIEGCSRQVSGVIVDGFAVRAAGRSVRSDSSPADGSGNTTTTE